MHVALEISYQFSQRFGVSAQKAFNWCTSFHPKDHVLMGDENAERKIMQITEGTLILKDTFNLPAQTVKKQKLVKIYPNELSWTSTHLTGPNKYSQFLYKITSLGKDISILNFTATHIEYDENVDAVLLADRLCKEDEAAWKFLAKAMADEQNVIDNFEIKKRG